MFGSINWVAMYGMFVLGVVSTILVYYVYFLLFKGDKIDE